MAKGVKITGKPVDLYGSRNGWLKIFTSEGKTLLLKPDFMAAGEEPTEWFVIGKYEQQSPIGGA